MNKETEMIPISSIQDYLNFLEGNKGDYYYRGESAYFPNRVASAYRSFINKSTGSSDYLNYQEIFKQFYREAGNQITNIEKENLLAFAQHHGVPTSLIDVSTNPLVALYFATYNENPNSNDEGYIYLYDKNYTIDISKFVQGQFSTDFSDILIGLHDHELAAFLVTEIRRIINYSGGDFEKMFSSLLETILSYQDMYAGRRKLGMHSDRLSGDYFLAIREFVEKDYNITKASQYLWMIDTAMKPEFQKFVMATKNIGNISEPLIQSYIPEDRDKNWSAHAYLYILILFLKFIRQGVINCENNLIPIIPIFVYNTSYKFDRIQTQSGSFFYQIGLYKNPEKPIIDFQQFPTYKVLKITNIKEISKQLDLLHINQMVLFNDVDNIAKYVTQKYGKEEKY